MKVYTYYEQAKELNDFSPLIELWKEKWLAAGHEPVVINSSFCKPKVLFNSLCSHVNSLPTINPKQYTLNNFTRWLAMDYITRHNNEGALHLDSDVFPNNFILPCFDLDKITVWQKDLCPCGFWIPKSGSWDIVKHMFSYKQGTMINGREHCCDQEFVRWVFPKEKWNKNFAVIDFIKSYLTEHDWESGSLIHYPTANLPAGDKAETLRKILC